MITKRMELEKCLENCISTGLGLVIKHTNGMIYMYPTETLVALKANLMFKLGDDLQVKGSQHIKIKEYAPVEDVIINQVYGVVTEKGSR